MASLPCNEISAAVIRNKAINDEAICLRVIEMFAQKKRERTGFLIFDMESLRLSLIDRKTALTHQTVHTQVITPERG